MTARLALLLLLSVSVARAEEARDPIAIQLFDEGRALVAAGDFEHACPKFAAAHARVSWLGVLLNLADCYEHIGRTATAWALFREAADRAELAGDARATYVRERIAALEPQLARVAIVPAPDTGPGLDVQLDGKTLAELVSAIPLDPGHHEIQVTQVGHRPWSSSFDLATGGTTTIAIPRLDLVPMPATSAPIAGVEASTPVPAARPSRVPFAIGGAGLAAVVGSLALGIDAKLRLDRAHDGHCDASLACDSEGYRLVRSARWRGNVATGLGITGALAIGTGLVLHLRHREVSPVIAPSTIGVTVRGAL